MDSDAVWAFKEGEKLYERNRRNRYSQPLGNDSFLLCTGGRRGVEVSFTLVVEISTISHK